MPSCGFLQEVSAELVAGLGGNARGAAQGLRAKNWVLKTGFCSSASL